MQAVTRALHLFAPNRLDDDRWAQRYLDMALGASPPDLDARRGLLGQQAATTAYDERLDALRGILVPTLVVGFELDILVPAKLTREVAAAISGSQYVEIPRCGHGGPWERPAELNAVLLEFLDRVSNRP